MADAVFKPPKGGKGDFGGAAPPLREGDKVAKMVADMNQSYALVLVGAKAVVLHEDVDEDGQPVLRFLSIAAFEQWWRNHVLWLPGQPRPTSFADAWLDSAQRRQYSRVVFEPGRELDGCYNLWRGFAVDPDSTGDFSIYRDHVLNNVCHGDDGLYRWVMGWFAHMVQKPRAKLGTALVLRGKQGTGKTKVGEVIGRLFPAHYSLVDEPRYITGQFNDHMESCLLLQADEGFWAGDKQAEGRLKGLVTSKVQYIERKGIDAIKVKNYLRLMISSNNDWVIPAGFEERRFGVLDVGDHCMQNSDYFREMDEQLDGGGLAGLLHYLLTFDLDCVDLRAIPATAGLLEQKLDTMEDVDAWWYERLRAGGLLPGHVEWRSGAEDDDDAWVSSDGLYQAYVKWAEKIGIKRRRTDGQFGKKLRRWVSGLVRKQRTHTYETDDGLTARRRMWCLRFPTLDECRAQFEDIVRQPVNWEE
ncbi:MAG: hypothetical protein HQL35_14830 [Alphaproteobacteria bacterium]|nr:hypothetical protein [Alphaproteobacteria bacterium]